jgi:hypothetical protein
MTTPAQWLDRLADGATARPALVRLAEADIAAIQVDAIADARSQCAALRTALERLYDETADYITINHLGDAHHNRSMQMARDALAAIHPARSSADDCAKP